MNLLDWEQYQGFAWSWKVEKNWVDIGFAHTFTFFFFWYWTSLTTRREILREFLTFLPIRISFFLFLNFLPFSNFSRHLSLSLSSSSHSLTYSLTHKRAVCAHTFSTTNDFFLATNKQQQQRWYIIWLKSISCLSIYLSKYLCRLFKMSITTIIRMINKDILFRYLCRCILTRLPIVQITFLYIATQYPFRQQIVAPWSFHWKIMLM